jgi:hypothetical protein
MFSLSTTFILDFWIGQTYCVEDRDLMFEELQANSKSFLSFSVNVIYFVVFDQARNLSFRHLLPNRFAAQ